MATPTNTPQGAQGTPKITPQVDTSIQESAGAIYPGDINEPKIFIQKGEARRRPKVGVVQEDITMTLDEWEQYWNKLDKNEREEYISLFKQIGMLRDKPSFAEVKTVWSRFGEYASTVYNNGAGISVGDEENVLLNPLELLAYEVSSAAELSLIEETEDGRLVQELTPEAELESFRNTVDTSIRRLASRNGIGLGEDYINVLVDSVTEGKDTLENIELSLRKNYIANAFPAFSEQILQGRDVYDLASPYIAKMASMLEVNQFDISLDDPIIQRAIQAVDTNGKPTLKPLWMFEQELKELPQYEFTNRGQQEAIDLGMKLLKGFGLA